MGDGPLPQRAGAGRHRLGLGLAPGLPGPAQRPYAESGARRRPEQPQRPRGRLPPATRPDSAVVPEMVGGTAAAPVGARLL
ncbi:hypothetical protein [Streptomyces mirabilis]|uniref:hypothetical protein n=1 Tax=Streptomyces mirabilis TaxID=68239 RepID=UPI0015A55D93|nr:hypothetical protein [Streptomyces mirabilis]